MTTRKYDPAVEGLLYDIGEELKIRFNLDEINSEQDLIYTILDLILPRYDADLEVFLFGG